MIRDVIKKIVCFIFSMVLITLTLFMIGCNAVTESTGGDIPSNATKSDKETIPDKRLRDFIDTDADEIEYLFINDLKINDLTGIGTLTNLKELHFSYEFVCDKDKEFFDNILPVEQRDHVNIVIDLPRYDFTEYQLDKIEDLDGLSIQSLSEDETTEMTYLLIEKGYTYLTIGHAIENEPNHFYNLAFLQKCSNLKSLTLVLGYAETDIKAIAELANLEYLKIGNGEYDTEIVSKLTGLKTLKILNNDAIKDTDFISTLSELEVLEINESNTVMNLTGIGKLKKLKRLEITEAVDLIDIKPLSNLTKLEHLTITNAEFTEVESLSQMTELKTLYFERCRNIESIKPLSSLINLEELTLNLSWRVKDISSIAKLSKLTKVDLSEMRSINDISPLKELKNLEYINLTGCDGIQDFSVVKNMEGVKVIK